MADGSEDPGFTPEEMATCVKVLRQLARQKARRGAAPPEIAGLSGLLQTLLSAEQDRTQKRRDARREELHAHDRSLLAATGLRRSRQDAPPVEVDGAAQPLLHRSRRCYICKERYGRLHFFYDSLCPSCAAFNYGKRTQTADLVGLVALVTGARIKIGYQITLKLLRGGAHVIGTTRFSADAAARYRREPDFPSWRDRLQLHGLDLRHLGHVEAFAAHLCQHGDRLDVLINNAAQTIRHPPSFYAHLLAGESTPLLEPPPGALVPAPAWDRHGQPLDLRERNSWSLHLHDVGTAEAVEVHLVNALSPFLLNSRLKPLLLRGTGSARYIINVSAVEGQFYRRNKSPRHPHTNMAKAALNMMTRTAAADYARDRIYMNSVDTGWITNENPHPLQKRMEAHGFHPPLDEIDGAARVLDPVFTGLTTGENGFGHFLKDYRPAPW